MKRINFFPMFIKKRPYTVLSVFDLTKIKWYFENNITGHAYQVLTEQTCADLDFDSFFIRMNGTSSCVGQQYLYDRLRRIPFETEMKGRDELIQYLKSNPDSVLRCRKHLSGLANDDAYCICSLFHDNHPTLSPLMRVIIRILQFMPLLFTLFFIIFSKGIFLFAAGFFFITNMVLHYRNKKIQFIYLYSIPQLLKLISIAKKMSVETPFSKAHPDIENHLKSLDSLVRRLSRFRFDAKIESEMAALAYMAKELVDIFFLSELNTLFHSFRMIDLQRERIEAVFHLCRACGYVVVGYAFAGKFTLLLQAGVDRRRVENGRRISPAH